MSHCRILSPNKTDWRFISPTLCGCRRCFVADQLFFNVTHTRRRRLNSYSFTCVENVEMSGILTDVSEILDFCHAVLCISTAIAVMQCLSVCLSVRLSVILVDHVKMNKHIFDIFSPLGSHTILVFHTKWGGDIAMATPTLERGCECRWGIGRNRDSGLIAVYRRLLDVRSAENIYRR